jgi:hypothetical protein
MPGTHEEVISSHSWLSWDTSGDDNNVRVLEGLLGSVVRWEEALNLSWGGNVREISGNLFASRQGSKRIKEWGQYGLNRRWWAVPERGIRNSWRRTITHTDGVHDIVKRELSDERVELEKQGQWLTNTT